MVDLKGYRNLKAVLCRGADRCYKKAIGSSTSVMIKSMWGNYLLPVSYASESDPSPVQISLVDNCDPSSAPNIICASGSNAS